jgi:hypothetical protein
MNVGVMKNYKLRDLRASHTLDIGEIGHLLSRQNEYFFSWSAPSARNRRHANSGVREGMRTIEVICAAISNI